jgi:hypothetical protein
MDNSLKGLILAAGVIITCLVVGLGFYLSREAKNTSNNGASQISSMNTEYQDVDKTMYDGLVISGREVSDLVKKAPSANFVITVKTGRHQAGKDYSAKAATLSDINTDDYINPTAEFLGKITYDTNNVISGLTLTQQ